MNRELFWKKCPRFVPFSANLAQLEAKSDSLVDGNLDAGKTNRNQEQPREQLLVTNTACPADLHTLSCWPTHLHHTYNTVWSAGHIWVKSGSYWYEIGFISGIFYFSFSLQYGPTAITIETHQIWPQNKNSIKYEYNFDNPPSLRVQCTHSNVTSYLTSRLKPQLKEVKKITLSV